MITICAISNKVDFLGAIMYISVSRISANVQVAVG
jgi:hypothetical protein